MSIVFVTGTDTGVGKTVVTAALAGLAGQRGRSVCMVKPAQTGVLPDAPGDLADVRRLAGEVAVVEGIRLEHPLAPEAAAAVEGVDLPPLEHHRDLILRAASAYDVVLVEGAGGVTVNLGSGWSLLDLAAAVGGEVVVVARAGLGTLNHSVLTVDALRHRGLVVQGLVIGAWPSDPGLAESGNRVDLARLTGVPLLGAIPDGAGSYAAEAFAAGVSDWVGNVRL